MPQGTRYDGTLQLHLLNVLDLLGHLVQNVDNGSKQLAFLGVGIQTETLGQTLQISDLFIDTHNCSPFGMKV